MPDKASASELRGIEIDGRRVQIRSRSTSARPPGTAAPNGRWGRKRDQAAVVCTKTIVTDFQAKSPAVADGASYADATVPDDQSRPVPIVAGRQAKAMKDAEIEDFLEGFNQPTYRGMRVNRVRVATWSSQRGMSGM